MAENNFMKLQYHGDPTEKVKQFYDHYPFHGFNIHYLKFLSLTEREIKNKNILDAGCGCGAMVKQLNDKGANCIGIDISSVSISLARKYYPELKNNFICQDILLFNTTQKFDIIICIGILHHSPYTFEILDKLITLLKPNGTLIIGLYNYLSIYRFLRALINLLSWIVGQDNTIKLLKNIRFLSNTPDGKIYDWNIRDKYFHPYQKYFSIKTISNYLQKKGLVITKVLKQNWYLSLPLLNNFIFDFFILHVRWYKNDR